MSLPPQVNKPAKHRPMKDPVHPAEVYYGLGPPALDHPDMSAGTSGAYTADKLPPNMGHYHQPQPAPVKWMHQDAPVQASGWAQEAPPLPGWGQSFAPSYMGGVNVRGFHKGVHEGLPMGAETQMQEVFRDNAQWEQMHQIQSYPHQPQQTMQPQTQTMQTMQTQAQTMQTQAQAMQPQTMQPQTMQAPMLQPFQTFRQNKPQQAQFNPGYYQGFAQKPGAQMQSLGYSEQPKQQQPSLLQQIQQQQQQQIQLQQLQMQQHLQQQQQQRQMQTQYQQPPQQHVQERHMQPMSHQPAQQDVQVTVAAPKLNFAAFERQDTNLEPPRPELTETELRLEKVAGAAYGAASTVESPPRRSRRLSREGQSPGAEQPQNGLTAAGPRAEGVTGGVIQSTRTRRRRASKEINLETLAQQAAKRESLPAKGKDDASSGRQSSMAPLVIPVSVPVPRAQQGAPGGQQPEGPWSSERPRSERGAGQGLHKASVIVARRRSLRNSVNERTLQDGENDSGTDEDGKPRPKRRPRPEPLIIPPPRPSSFIPASVYSSITPYQSHLRSPVHPLDHPVMLPPYTPPPILSPVRAGSGLYFSTFLSNMAAAGTQAPPAITKSVSVSLLRLSSAESTPPVTIVTDATPVSLEPRINIGPQYQADIPELQSRVSSQQEQHRADLLWLPMEHLQHGAHDRVRDLMNMACSSVLSGGGTNQELVLHCLFQSRGDVLQTLERLMLQNVLFPKGHPLCDYHYSGSDSWSPEEKRYFNKGISAYRKDFIMVQKLVQTKSVAQCVEFYYTYKKQVKVGRSGTLTFGPADLPTHSHEEVIDNKSSQQPRVDLNEAELNHQPEPPSEPSAESSHQARVAQSLQAHDYAVPGPEPAPQPVISQPPLQTSAPPRPRSEPQAKKGKAPPKPPADPDQVFPCKKCGRVFYKVKSRSAHMKSHAEQEKKAAALRQKEQEDQLRTRTVPVPESRPGPRRAEASDQIRARASGLYREQGSGAESSEADDAADEDWH